jgi:hypothetical protein
MAGQHEARRKRERHGSAGDRDRAVFKRLAENFEDVAEFGQLVEKEQTIVSKRDFTGARDHTASDEAGIGDRVMRRTIGARSDQPGALIEYSGDAVNLGRFQGFFKCKGRQNGRHSLGEHGLAGAGRADHENVVASGTGDLEGALGGLLAADVFEVDEELLGFAQEGVAVGFDGKNAVA